MKKKYTAVILSSNPIDMGTSSTEGTDYTKTGLSPGTCFEVAKLRESVPSMCPREGRHRLGNVNLKVGTWTLVSGILVQEAPPNHLRLASLPSKPCSHCKPEKRCLKTWGQNIFIRHQVKQVLNGRGPVWMSDQRILRYQVVFNNILPVWARSGLSFQIFLTMKQKAEDHIHSNKLVTVTARLQLTGETGRGKGQWLPRCRFRSTPEAILIPLGFPFIISVSSLWNLVGYILWKNRRRFEYFPDRLCPGPKVLTQVLDLLFYGHPQPALFCHRGLFLFFSTLTTWQF